MHANKKRLVRIGMVTAMTLLSSHSVAVPGANCPKMEWPREALRYEIDGVSTLRFAVGKDGKAMSPSVQRSSGWKILDDAALRNLAACEFAESNRDGELQPLQYVWKLEGAERLHPLVVPGSCMASPRFETFANFDKSTSSDRGVVLRMLINSEGKPFGVKPEAQNVPTDTVAAAVAFVQSCKFVVDPEVVGERTDTIYGKVMMKRQ